LFLKTGASVVGAGTWNIGTSGAPIPFASKHTITGAAGWYVDGVAGLTMNVYGAEPTYTTIKLSADEAAGQTELSVDTDVTGDIWAAGDIIRIDDINKAKESEERIIAAGGIATNTITITAGLTAAKSTGAVVSLITRNIRIIAVGTGSYTIYRVGTGSVTKLTVAGGMWYGVNKGMFNACPYLVVSGGTISGNGDGISSCSNSVVSGGVFSGNSNGISNCSNSVVSGGVFSGNSNGISNCSAATISGGTISGNGGGIINCSNSVVSGGTISGNAYGIINCSNSVVSGGTISGNTYGISNCSAATISGGTISGNDYGISSCSNSVVSGGTISGNDYGISNCSAATISGGTISGNGDGIINCSNSVVSGGTISGNDYGISYCSNSVVSGGTISGNDYGIISCSNSVVSGGTFNGNNYDIANTTGNLFGVELTSATEYYQYANITNWWHNLQSDNHDAVDGAVKAWCKGGVVTSQTAIKPDGYMQACAHALESATYPAFWYKKFTVPAGQIYSIEVQLRKSTSMAYLPRVYLMASIGNPLAGAAPVDTFTMTDSVNTWESDTFTVDNSAGDYDLDYALWFVGQNATGSVYSAVDITTQGGGTSSVKILPFTGKVAL
jgi:hypothetical protein